MKNFLKLFLIFLLFIPSCGVKVTEDMSGIYELHKSDIVGGYYMKRDAKMKIWKDNRNNYKYEYYNEVYDAMYGSKNSEKSAGDLKVTEKIADYHYKFEVIKSSNDFKDKVKQITISRNSLSFSWVGGKANNFSKTSSLSSEINKTDLDGGRKNSLTNNEGKDLDDKEKAESPSSKLYIEDRIIYGIANTSFTLEFISNTEGKIFYEDGIGFTTIKYKMTLPNGNIQWEEMDGKTKTGTFIFKDSFLDEGVFLRYKDNKKLNFNRLK